MIKKELREIFRGKRNSISHTEKEKLDDLILIQFQKIPFHDLQMVHTFLSSEKLGEPDTSRILRYLRFCFPGIGIAAPKIDSDRLAMKHFLIDKEEDIQQNNFGIDEPVSGVQIEPDEIDLVIVPLLIFDRQGFRVGFGKGYYDRFLRECREDVLKVGISFFEPVNKISDTDKFDISLDYCCTPHNLYNW